MTTADPKTKDPIARIAPRRVYIEKFGVELGPVVLFFYPKAMTPG